jgi:uncharacterized protein (TIGR02145 family)
MKKYLLFSLLVNTEFCFSQLSNINTGLWSDTAIWNINRIPTSVDSVYLNHDIIVDVNGSCRFLNTNGHNVVVNSNVTLNILDNPVDIDGNHYSPVRICSQVWMKENLNVTHYRNGDTIPQAVDSAAWLSATDGVWCYYNNDSSTAQTYGRIYNWHAVKDPRGLAPSGWHIASDSEWITLSNCLGGDSVSGGALKESDTSHWHSPNTLATNSSNFTALPGGVRTDAAQFVFFGFYGYWWTSTEVDAVRARRCYLGYNHGRLSRGRYNKVFGHAVRCIKD